MKIGEAEDIPGGLFGGQSAHGPAEAGEGFAGAVGMKDHSALEKGFGAEVAEDHVGIGDGGLISPAIAGGSGAGSGAFGADPQGAAGIDRGDGAAAGADGVHVHHGHADGKAAEGVPGGDYRLLPDQRDIGGGAAHVEGDEISVMTPGPRDSHGPDHPGGGTGKEGVHGFAGGALRGHAAPVGLDDMQTGGGPLFEAGEIASHGGGDIGVDKGGGAAFDFAEFGQNLGGERDLKAFGLQRGAQDPLMFRSYKAEEKENGHGFDAVFTQGLKDVRKRGEIERGENGAVGGDAFGEFEAEVTGDEAGGAAGKEVVETGAVLAADLEDIPEAGGGDDRGFGAFAFEQRVGGHGGAVEEGVRGPAAKGS